MDILVIGNDENLNECRAKFGESHRYERIDHFEPSLQRHSIVFDFVPRDISVYQHKDQIVFLNSCKTTLSKLTATKESPTFFAGFCGLPTFLDREILELTLMRKEQYPLLEKTVGGLNTKFKIVDDRVGMVTPRIICMIINEAYFTLEEGVASKADIDLAMKLGTNYPYGPFEWSQKIGVNRVYELLKAVYDETKDERYRISAMLESEAKLFLVKSQSR